MWEQLKEWRFAGADLNNAINIEIDGNHMTLRLDRDVGIMHFQSSLPE